MHYVAIYEFLIGWQDENVLFICVRYLQSLTQDFIYKAAEWKIDQIFKQQN